MVELRVSHKVFYTLLLLAAIVVIAQFGWAGNVDKTRSWHDLDQVRRNSTNIPDNNNSLDLNRDGKVDYANNAEYADYAYEGGTDCLNYRGQPSPNDKVLWCNETYKKLLSCEPVMHTTTDAIVINSTPDCGGDGDCNGVGLGPARNEVDTDFIYTERVLKETGNSTFKPLVEGCYAYSTGATSYRLDITCCSARFVGAFSPSDCGNGVIDASEQCDGANLGGETCQSLGYDYGTLSCRSDCMRDTSECRSDEYNPPHCFGGETLVLTRGGLLPIAELVVGMEVLGRDLAAGVDVWAVVEEARERGADGYLLINERLRVTSEHPFAVQNDGRLRWVRAKGLVPGMRLVTQDGVLTVDSVVFVDESLAVYNPALSAPHTYYVLLDGEPVLVHNRKAYPYERAYNE